METVNRSYFSAYSSEFPSSSELFLQEKLEGFSWLVLAAGASISQYMCCTQAGQWAERQWDIGFRTLFPETRLNLQFETAQQDMAEQAAGTYWIEEPLELSLEFQAEAKIETDPTYEHLGIGISTSAGRKANRTRLGRNPMEDAYVVSLPDQHSPFACCPIFGVFDGHNGSTTSNLVANNISTYIYEALQRHSQWGMSDGKIITALREAFQLIDRDCPEDQSGTTATVALILNGALWVAHVGDSRAMFNDNGIITQLSRDSDCSSLHYREQILALGGKFNYVNQVMGAEGTLGEGLFLPLASSIGDSVNFPGVTSDPEIIKYPLSDDFGYRHLILTTDGISGITADPNIRGEAIIPIANTHQIATKVQACAAMGMTPAEIAQNLVATAYRANSQDNITAMIVDLSNIPA